jgi:hypothetical protein
MGTTITRGIVATVAYFLLLLSHFGLGFLTSTATPLISASPHLSGPLRAATVIRRTFIRGVSLGSIMSNPGGKAKKKTVALGLIIDD